MKEKCYKFDLMKNKERKGNKKIHYTTCNV